MRTPEEIKERMEELWSRAMTDFSGRKFSIEEAMNIAINQLKWVLNEDKEKSND